jgi:hypothetical protein
MDKIDFKTNNILKLTFLDIIPPISELIKAKEDINMIFQGNDTFYDLKKVLSNKISIQLPYMKNSLIITLLKNNNIFATGFFTIRQGEQNIAFNYENNKKNILIKNIKLKILCEIENNSSTLTINRNTINYNFSDNKYVPKVNLMKSMNINNHKNKIGKKIYEKKKKFLGNNHQIKNNNSIKRNFINNSQELISDEYTSFLTEEIKQNFYTNKISKMNTSTARKNESKNYNRLNKAKSKNNFSISTSKKQNKSNYDNKIKMNNSSLNLINQSNNISHNLYKNYQSNRNSLKPNISFGKTNIRRNSNNTKLVHKNNKTSLDNYISGQIVEHINISSANTEKKDYININKNVKISNNNITMNSISTNITKKNELEFSMNSLLQDNDDKIINKNNFKPFSNGTKNIKYGQKIKESQINNENNNININIIKSSGKHKTNKSLCQQSFTDKIFNNENNIFINNEYNLSQSDKKLFVNSNNSNDILINNEIDEIDLDNNYTKIKEDFDLLYNESYIKNINEDLLKLEAELFIEKMNELFLAYHSQIDEKILENKIIHQEYKINKEKYLIYNKLKDKLEHMKKKEKNDNYCKEKFLENIEVNKDEMNIYKIVFKNFANSEDNKTQLKIIMKIILNKEANRELIDEKYKNFYYLNKS